MKDRILGATIVCLYATTMLISPKPVYILLTVILGILAMHEISTITGIKKYPTIVTFILCFFIYIQIKNFPFSLMLLILGIFLTQTTSNQHKPNPYLLSSISMAIYTYTGIISISQLSKKLFIMLITLVWSIDTFSYITGIYTGRTKLSPNISPNKTIEGAIGGSIAGICLGAIACELLKITAIQDTKCLAFLILFAIAAQTGDLLESYFKRIFNVKDSGEIIPGHGGILDRIDSSLAIAPLLLLVENIGWMHL